MSQRKDAKEPEIICNGKYQILPAILGSGGWGKVYKGIRLEDGVFVAVKKIQLQQVPVEMLDSIMNEINYLKVLSHPMIVKYLDSEKTPGCLYIVLELVESGSLADIAQLGRFPEQLIVNYLSQIIEGLTYLHKQGVIHADIKGANILLTKTGQVKLADFGIATKAQEVNPENLVQGSPYWMAPEVVNFMGVSTKSDVWSVGCTVVELITGKPPYYELPAMTALFKIGQEDSPPLPDGISSACRDFLNKCFQKEPLLRQSAEELLKHPWIVKYSKTKRQETQVEEATNMVQRYATLTLKSRSRIMETVKSSQLGSTERVPLKTLFEASEAQIANNAFLTSSPRSPRREKTEIKTITRKTPRTIPKEDIQKLNLDKTSSNSSKTGSVKSPRDKSSKRKSSPRRSRREKIAVTTKDNPANILKGSDDDSPSTPQKLQGKEKSKPRGSKFKKVIDNLSHPASSSSSPIKLVQHRKEGSMPASSNATKRVLRGHVQSTYDLFEADLSQFAENSNDDWDDIGSDSEDLLAKLEKPVKPRRFELHSQRSESWENDNSVEDWDEEEIFESSIRRSFLDEISKDIIKKLQNFGPQLPKMEIQGSAQILIDHFENYPEQKIILIREHGAIPLMDMISRFGKDTNGLAWCLRIINKIIDGQPDLQESLTLLGGIPAVVKYSDEKFATLEAVHHEVAVFINHLLAEESSTMKMFIAAQGLLVLANLLQPKEDLDTYLIAINCIDKILHINLNLRLHIPKNDFCRLWVKYDLLPRLIKLLCAKSQTFMPEEYMIKIANFIFTFSKADAIVKQHFTQEALKETFVVLSQLPPDVILLLLKSYRNLTSEESLVQKFVETKESIPSLVSLFGNKKLTQAHYHYALNILCNLCTLDANCRELAGNAGIVPHLKRIVQESRLKSSDSFGLSEESPLKKQYKQPIEFALPMMFEFVRTKSLNHILLLNHCIPFFISLFDFQFPYSAQAADALAVWLTQDKKRVGDELSKPEHSRELVRFFKTAEKETFERLPECYLKITECSSKMCEALITQEFIPVLLERFSYPKTEVGVSLIKLLDSLYKTSKKQKALITTYNLLDFVEKFENNDIMILKETANKLVVSMKKCVK